MRMHRFRFVLPTVVAAFGALNSAGVEGSASGLFENPQDPGAVVEIDNNNPGFYSAQFTWGTAPTDGSKSYLGYTSPSDFSITGDGSTFSVGDLDYWNGQSEAGTGAKSIDLKLNIDLDGLPSQPFTFRLQIENIGNDNPTKDGALANADIVRFLDPTYDSQIDLGAAGKFYLSVGFVLLPGQGDGQLIENDTALQVVESGSAVAMMVAKISSANPNASVPDSSSTLALLGMAFASLSLLRRRNRR